MAEEFYLHFEDGMPKGTAQMKGERIGWKRIGGKLVPYIDHYRKANVQMARSQFILKMKPYRPKQPSERPIRLTVCLYFDISKPKKLWGKYKTTRPDCDNYVKEIKDVMTDLKFWNDDAQVVDLRVIKRYSEKATIYISLEELDEKTKKKTKTELREEEMKKKQSQLEAARRDICDEYLNCIISIPEEKLEDVYSVKYLVVSRIWDQLEKLEAYITDFDHIYGVKSNRKDWTLLQETYKDFDLLQRMMLNMWKALASDYQNKFISYPHMKCEKVLEAHQELYEILRKFGFRLDPEMEAVIEGTSELYLIDGKEV